MQWPPQITDEITTSVTLGQETGATPITGQVTGRWQVLLDGEPLTAAEASRFATPVERGTDPQAAARLSRLIGPFVLRRRKSDPQIAPELPAKTETDLPVALTAEQAALYETVVTQRLTQIRQSDGIQRRGQVLRMLTQLKQICNHPAHYLHQHPNATVLSGRSGKLEAFDDLVDTILAEGTAALVFTQYVAMARLLASHLTGRRVTHALLHGGTPVPQRDQLVDTFQQGRTPVLLLSLKAAGTGLNLTRAEHVIHYDRWWNPAVEQQATDRAYRLGQTQAVQVHRLITEGTVEERIGGLLRRKQDLAETVLTGGDPAWSDLSDEQLANLVTLRSRR
ncbi:DEAD/DEAH box helicase [Natronosporangium hydrolyticum]|uniref:DEAD/DEAH box helicase n=1 Tax=Natronosporangium hydrolyticum TaxID=2811111 RepID=UPI001EFA1C23|nr:DEAD/DEAH box helicase [Natronosporangium hydrolyticum]